MALGPDQGFCNTLQQYDDYGLGTRVKPASLEPFCVQLDAFSANYRDTGQPEAFRRDVSYNVGSGAPKHAVIKPNEPLRLDKARLYVTGHGYSAMVKYTDKYGVSQTTVAPLLPADEDLTSNGAISFPDANLAPAGNATRQQAAGRLPGGLPAHLGRAQRDLDLPGREQPGAVAASPTAATWASTPASRTRSTP